MVFAKTRISAKCHTPTKKFYTDFFRYLCAERTIRFIRVHLSFLLVENEKVYESLVHFVDGQLDPTPAVFRVMVLVVWCQD